MTTNRSTSDTVEQYTFEPIKGYPMLNWRGKRPFSSTQYYPAQHKETHGPEVAGWRNKIYWGDNLQVMSHLLKQYRGKVQLVYIDPPFDSKADYKRKISIRGQGVENNLNVFEEKQYADIWTNDEYLQFMYERLMIIRELIEDEGVLCVHCDWHKGHYIRAILDEIYGPMNFVNDIIWQRTGAHNDADRFGIVHDYIFVYAKATKHPFNPVFVPHSSEHLETRFNLVETETGKRFFAGPITAPGNGPPRKFNGQLISPPSGRHWSYSQEGIDRLIVENRIYYSNTGTPYLKQYMDEYVGQGRRVQSLWTDILPSKTGSELVGYPTQKPSKLLQRIVEAFTKPDDIVLDCFMGSGTTQAVAMKLGRRFIGADINLGAVQITSKRLIAVGQSLARATPAASPTPQGAIGLENADVSTDGAEVVPPTAISTLYTGFEVYNVNNYDIFRNPVEAKELLIEALEINRLQAGSLFDGEKDGRMWKIMPINRITTRQDLNELINGFDQRLFKQRAAENPRQPVERITLVCMGHEPDLAAQLQRESDYNLDVNVVDILRDKQDLQFKRDSEARVVAKNGELVIEQFYPMNLLSKLSLQQENVEDWRELVESIMIDWNYDGAVLQPALLDIPATNALVTGRYPIPADAGTIRIKITDLLSESLEKEVRHG